MVNVAVHKNRLKPSPLGLDLWLIPIPDVSITFSLGDGSFQRIHLKTSRHVLHKKKPWLRKEKRAEKMNLSLIIKQFMGISWELQNIKLQVT